MIPLKTRLVSALRGLSMVARTAASALVPGAPPSYLIFFVTHRCNAACSFCFNRENAKDPGPELTLSQVERIAAGWRGLIQVTLTGGEPFLREDIADIALAFAGGGAKSITIATNGILTERIVSSVEAILETAPGIFLDLDLSIDGSQEVHDRLRMFPGAHEKVMETAERLFPLQSKYPGFRIGATVTVSAFNRETAPQTVRELIESGLFQRVQALRVRGRPFDPEALDNDLSAYESCREILSSGKLSRGTGRIREALSERVREVVATTAREERMVLPCRAGRTMVTLGPNGDVYPCEMLGQLFPEAMPDLGIESWVTGSLGEPGSSIKQVMQSDGSKRVIGWISETGCYCGFECAAYNNIVFNPGQWPAIVIGIVKKFL